MNWSQLPVTALVLLSVYWLALLLGRIVCQAILPNVGHGKLLMTNVLLRRCAAGLHPAGADE